MPKSKQAKILSIAIILYIAIFCFITLKKYYNFGYNSFDLAIFNQVFFNTLRGDWFFGTVNVNTYLADHFSPIIILLLPFYWLRQTPEALLVLQSIVSGLCAWPLYLIAKQITKNHQLALATGLLWLANPFVHNANLYEWHILTIAAFFIFWTFYFYIKNNFKLYILFFILSLACREDIFLVMLGFGILSFLDKKSWSWKLFSIILPVIYFLAAIKIIGYYSVAGDYKFFVYYGWLGGQGLSGILWSWLIHPWQTFIHVFSLKNLFVLFIILLPWLFLPIRSPKYWSLSILPLAQLMLTAAGLNFAVYSNYYAMLFLPGLFISLILALEKTTRSVKYKNIMIFLLTTAGIYFLIFLSPLTDGLLAKYDANASQAKQELIADIPRQASLAVELSLQAPLSSRQIIYSVEYGYYGYGQFASHTFELPPVDYIVMDYSDFIGALAEAYNGHFWRLTRDQMPAHWREILADYDLIKAQNNLYLWQNKKLASGSGLKFYEVNPRPADLGNLDFLVYQNWENNILKLTFQKKIDADKNYLIRFYKDGGYFDIPLDYGVYPIKEWSDDELYTFYYYPDSRVNSFEIFSWTGENKLGPIKNVIVDLLLDKI